MVYRNGDAFLFSSLLVRVWRHSRCGT